MLYNQGLHNLQLLAVAVFTSNVVVAIYDVIINRTDDGGYVGWFTITTITVLR